MSEQQAKFRDILNVYSFGCKLPGSGQELEFKPLTTGQLKKLLSYEGETNPIIQELAIDELINSSVITEDFDSDSLLLEDRFFLLIQIRKKSKGEVLEFTNTCTKCKSQTMARVSLDDLPTIEMKKDIDPIVDLGQGIKVNLKHITRRDYKIINPKKLKGLSELQASAEMQLFIHAIGIQSVETEKYGVETNLTIEDRKYLLENIPTNSYEKIKKWNDDNFFGVDFSYRLTCIKCRNTQDIEIPLDQAFFL